MRKPFAAIVAVTTAVLVLLPGNRALALCPNCLGQSSRVATTLGLVGVFLLVPFAVFFAVAIAIRKLSRPRH
jgi:hypothetical protein